MRKESRNLSPVQTTSGLHDIDTIVKQRTQEQLNMKRQLGAIGNNESSMTERSAIGGPSPKNGFFNEHELLFN